MAYEMVGTEEEKKKEEDPKKDLNVLEFYNLWFKYIVAYNTSFVIKQSYKDSQIQNLINVRPSLIKCRKISKVIIPILNQTL